MDLLPNPEQQQIIDSVREFFAAEFPLERLQSRSRGADDRGRSRWRAIGELGFFALGLSESHGGAGYSLAEEVLLLREAGRFLVTPSLLAQVIAVRIAVHSGLDARGLISGNERAAWIAPLGVARIDAAVEGEFHAFDDADANWFVTCNDDGAALIAVQSAKDRRAIEAIDSSIYLARIQLDGKADALVPRAGENMTARVRLGIAAQLVGIAEAARDMAVSYAKERKQFDQPIGAFQAVKHKCVDMAIRCEASWCQTVYAALAQAANQADAASGTAAALLLSSSAANENAAANVQVHGGFGFTAECNAHHFVKRARVLERLAGSLRSQQRAVLGEAAQ